MKPSTILAFLSALCLCSCAALRETPIQGCVATPYGKACYDSKGGLTVTVHPEK